MKNRFASMLARVPRMGGWLLLAVVLLGVVWLLAPQQLPVSLYKLSLVVTAAVVGYWIDRSLFPYARPDKIMDRVPGYELHTKVIALSGATLRRAVIVAAAMLAMGLGA